MIGAKELVAKVEREEDSVDCVGQSHSLKEKAGLMQQVRFDVDRWSTEDNEDEEDDEVIESENELSRSRRICVRLRGSIWVLGRQKTID
jgi:hypothetical protein